MGNGDSTAQTDSSNDEVSPQPTSFPPVDNHGAVPANKNIEFVLDIPLQVTVQIGSTRMLIRELLQLGQGSVIELTKLAGSRWRCWSTTSSWRGAKSSSSTKIRYSSDRRRQPPNQRIQQLG